MTPQKINNIPFPDWATPRGAEWTYVGWIGKSIKTPDEFDMALKSHKDTSEVRRGVQIRESDVYEQGATNWIKKTSPDNTSLNSDSVWHGSCGATATPRAAG